MEKILSLWDMCKHVALYTLPIAPLEINFLSNLFSSNHVFKGTKFIHLVPLEIFEIIHTF